MTGYISFQMSKSATEKYLHVLLTIERRYQYKFVISAVNLSMKKNLLLVNCVTCKYLNAKDM